MSIQQTLMSDFDPENIITGLLWRTTNTNLPYLFYQNGYWVLSDTLGSIFSVDGSDLATVFRTYNGKRYYTGSVGYLWYDSDSAMYILSSKLGYIYNDEEYWECATRVGTYESSESGGVSKTVTETLAGYQKDTAGGTIAGSYTEIGGTDKKYIGVEKYKDQYNHIFIQSLTEEYEDEYRYAESGSTAVGTIYNDGTGWVIGTRDSEAGWYEGSQPDISSPVTFTKQKTPTGSYPDYDSLTITFDSHIIGDNETEIYYMDLGRFY